MTDTVDTAPIKFLLCATLGLVCIMTWVSCSGDGVGLGPSGDLSGSGFDSQVQPIFDSNCTRCHAAGGIGFNLTGGAQNNGLNLTRGNSFASLVGQPTFEAPDTPPNLRVLPGDPDGSYIVQKTTSDSPKFGNRMPLDGPPYLSTSEIQVIRNWIAEGAPNN